MTRLIVTAPSRGKHWLRDAPTRPLSVRADMVARFRDADLRADRHTKALFGGILAVGMASIVAPFAAAWAGWL